MVFSGVPLASTGGVVGILASRHAFLDFGSSRIHRAVRRGGLERAGDDYVHQPVAPARASLEEAIVQGSMTRLRPVLMTALVASLGFVPMAFATGTGAGGSEAVGHGGDRRYHLPQRC